MRCYGSGSSVFTTAGLILILGALVACGGEAESAADRDGRPLQLLPPEEVQAPASGFEVEEGESAVPTPVSPAPSRPAPGSAVSPEPASEPHVPPAEVAPAEPEAQPVFLPIGARIHAETEIALSTRTHEAGERFHARVTEELLAADGMVLIPAGARLEGRVAEARRSTESSEEAILVLVFEALDLHGTRIPIVASVVEAQMEADAADSGARTAATIATGAAAGAIVGRILGRDTRSTLIGAAAGAAAGTGVALTTRDGHATLREGSRLVVRIDETVVLWEG